MKLYSMFLKQNKDYLQQENYALSLEHKNRKLRPNKILFLNFRKRK